MAGLAIVLSMVTLAALTVEFGEPRRSLLTRYLLDFGPHDQDVSIESPPTRPDARHWFGTDIFRRDLLSRVLHGARISIQVGITAELIALTIGLLAGALASHYGGMLDAAVMRVADVLLALPLPIVAMAVIAVFKSPSVTLVFVVLGMIGWAGPARLIRAQCLSVRARGYPEAARALGAGDLRMLACHVVPNAISPALVAASLGVAGNILTEAWLSFLGLGAQPPAISWGRMIVDASSELAIRPWLCVFPGLALAITAFGFVLLADGLRDALDPRSRLATHAL